MKIKTIIFITIIATLLASYIGLSVYNYEIEKEQLAYESGHQVGYLEGIVYTQKTGNIVVVSEEGNFSEFTIDQVCNNRLQQ